MYKHILIKETYGKCSLQINHPARKGGTRIGLHKINRYGNIIKGLSVELGSDDIMELIRILQEIEKAH